MLDALMKFGAHKINYFGPRYEANPKAFGFYIRAEIMDGEHYSHDAKRQLYNGLSLIQKKLEMKNLVGIYLDVDSLDNVSRPAYQQLKSDVLNGLFRRIFVLDEKALVGSITADRDFQEFFILVGGVELLTCRNGECVPVDVSILNVPLAV